jgi:hypothetical protein
MALVLADRVNETTTTTGLGTLTLAGAVSGYQSFSAIGNANTTYYTIVGQTTTEWEVGLGTYTSVGTTLSRDTVLASSAGGTTKVTLSAGTKFVFCDYPAGKAAYLDASNNLTLTNALGATYGGTGQTVYAVGDLLYASTTTALSKLADVATGSAVISGGVGVAPSYGKIGLTTHVSGTLPVANGGTGQTTYTDGQILIGNSTGNTLSKSTLTAGSNVTITNGSGTITIAASGGGSSTYTISNKTAAYTVIAGDLATIINCTTGSFTVSLTAAATLGSGFNCWIWNTGTGTSDTITIDPSGAETIDGVATLLLRQGEGTEIVCNGTNWATGAKKTMRGYAENIGSTNARPIASGNNAVALGRGSTASGVGAFALNFGSVASNDYAIAFGANTLASSAYSVAIGNNSAGFSAGSQAITGSGAMALGGSYASGTDSFAAAIGNNTSTYGAQGTGSIAISGNAKSTATYSVAIGYGTTASGLGSLAIGGYGVTQATASGSIAIGGGVNLTGAVAAAQNSTAIGDAAYVPTVKGKFAFGSDGAFAQGASQAGLLVLRRATTDATASTLGSDGLVGASTNQLILPNSTAMSFTGTVVARQQAAGGTASAAWTVQGLIRREGTAASTTLVASTVTAISNVPAWTLALSADTTNGGLTVTATGAAATNIRWVATLQTSEVTYA